MDPSLPQWTPRPPSPPPYHTEGTSSRQNADNSLNLSSLSLRLATTLDHGPALLPSPITTTAGPHTPPPIPIPTAAGVMSPPTPAPSPTPPERSWAEYDRRNAQIQAALGNRSDEHDDEQMRSEPGLPIGPDGSEDGYRDTDLGGGWKGKERMDTDPQAVLRHFQQLNKSGRFAFLTALINDLQLNEALVLSRKIEPRLRRDFLRELPTELALHCLSFVDEAKTLARAAQVSNYWTQLLQDEQTWKEMCDRHRFTAISSPIVYPRGPPRSNSSPNTNLGRVRGLMTPHSIVSKRKGSVNDSPSPRVSLPPSPSFRSQYKNGYLTQTNWLHGGKVLACHTSQADGVVTSLALDHQHLVIGMANATIHIFDATTAAYKRTLQGHELGVWTLMLVTPDTRRNSASTSIGSLPRLPPTRAQYRDQGQSRRASYGAGDESAPPSAPTDSSHSSAIPRPSTASGYPSIQSSERANRLPQSDVCGAARGWGNKRPLVVSGGCDRQVKVWDLATGECLHSMRGHTSTIRCVKVLDGRPIAVSGSRDYTLRVWDIEKGRLLRTLSGHDQSVRCIEVAGNQVVSGSYDYTCRLWDVDTGACLQILRGHYHQIYAVAFDGERVITGSLDSTVRVWSAATGECTSLLQGHTSLVGQLQLAGEYLVTGGSDGRVIIFDLRTGQCLHRLCAHDNSVTCLQFDDRFIVSGGNDGRVKLWDVKTGAFIRELTRPCDAVWRIAFKDDKCAILCQRNGKTVLEVISFKPHDVKNRALRG